MQNNYSYFSDFKMAVIRLTKNKILVYNSLSFVCFACGLIGYWTFMPKYMETQFRQSASSASLITGRINSTDFVGKF
jgi:Organic Anion Transporter Polypeptide (OATP) family.